MKSYSHACGGFDRTIVVGDIHGCCAGCRLKHVELLEAAHILLDSNPRGEPWVSNGICLCKLHHAAFDSQWMGIRPDLVVQIRKDILDE